MFSLLGTYLIKLILIEIQQSQIILNVGIRNVVKITKPIYTYI